MSRKNTKKFYVTVYYSQQEDKYYVRILPRTTVNGKYVITETELLTMQKISFRGFPQCNYWNSTVCHYENETEFEKNLPSILAQLIAQKDESEHKIKYSETTDKIYISFVSNFIFLPVVKYGKKIKEKYGKELVIVKNIPNDLETIELDVKIDEIKNGKVVEKARKVLVANRR